MRIDYDRNFCCTAVCITSMNTNLYNGFISSGPDWYRSAFPDGKIPPKIPDYWDPSESFRMFSRGLALLCNNFQEYCKRLMKNNTHDRPHWQAAFKIGDLSTVFCFTSTGDYQEEIEEFLQEFGFEGSSKRPSKKYRGESLVTLWSMDASEFQKKCDEIIKEMKDEHDAYQETIRPRKETTAVQGSEEESPRKRGRKPRALPSAA